MLLVHGIVNLLSTKSFFVEVNKLLFRGISGLISFNSDKFDLVNSSIFFFKSAGSKGLLMYPFIPASRHFCFSDEMAWAVIAIIGIELLGPENSDLIFWTAVYPSISGI